MSTYFGRQYRIEFYDDNGSLQRVIDSREAVHPLQVQFNIEVSFGAALSTMELSIFGLSKDSINQIAGTTRIEVQAGFPDAFGRIFYGRIVNFTTPRDGVERKMTLWCWSGYKEQKEKTCNVSFAEGTRYADIVDYIATDIFDRSPEYIGFDHGFRQSMGTTGNKGYSGDQSHKVLLDNLARDFHFQWLVESERCVLMERGASRTGEPYPVSAETGLVGGVALTFLGADFEMKLNPNIGIGDRVTISAESSTVNFSSIYQVSLPKEKRTIGDGVYVVKMLRRQGDFYADNSWNSALICWREGETGVREDGQPYAR